MERRGYLQAIAVAGGVAPLAGCTDGSGGDEPTETDGDAETEETEMDGDVETEETETGTGDGTSEPTETPPTDPDQRVAVGADGFNFEPESFEIAAGDTVLWEWESSGHNIAVESQPSDADWPGEDEEFGYSEGHTHSHTFEVAGGYEYFCEPHQTNGMEGSFTVTE